MNESIAMATPTGLGDPLFYELLSRMDIWISGYLDGR